MMLLVAFRSLTTRPLRSAVLAAGFGLGIGVMVELLGVGEVILEQAHSPALQGGGDLVVSSDVGPVRGARFVLEDVLGSPRFRRRLRAASPSKRATVYLLKPGQTIPIAAQAGVPSLERAIGDHEVADQRAWHDGPADAEWTHPSREQILRSLDRFHPVPPAASDASTEAAADGTGAGGGVDRRSWAEWLYFNGRSRDGSLRFYLSFIAGPPGPEGARPLGVHLQLDRNGRSSSYVSKGTVTDRELLDHAPDLDAGANRVRLAGSRYEISLDLEAGSTDPAAGQVNRGRRAVGTLSLDVAAGRSLPPAEIHGAGGWVSGYVVPALAGTFHGALSIGGEIVSFDGLAGYHDHNWGFWEGVRWQWGQVSNGELSIVFGRVFPPAAVADANRIPGFLGVLGPDGPIGFSTNVSIQEEGGAGRPRAIAVRAVSGDQTDLSLRLTVAETEQTATFLQLGGVYDVSGRVEGRDVAFTARGSAETFRPNP